MMRKNPFFGKSFLWTVLALAGTLLPGGVLAQELLRVATVSEVSEKGAVKVTLSLKNLWDRPLYHIHPMFHFHHSMVMGPMIHSLAPGESATLVNTGHPPVVQVGRYPLTVITSYKKSSVGPHSATQIHTDSFYYKEPVVSDVEGRMVASVSEGASAMRVSIKNNSSSFKNVQLALLMPPGLISETFKGMMGFTIRSGEEKHFEIPVSKLTGVPDGEYPVRLTIEYGELMKHYAGEIRGQIHFGAGEIDLWPHLIAIALLSSALAVFSYRLKSQTLAA
ncbi:MAG: hypothetical protein HY579_09895 [Nitrospinae bacterium]|nr:hypothetical protein [Nitrospinota bacterium]